VNQIGRIRFGNLDEVIQFYDRRFHIGFTSQESADLKAFLEAL